MSRQLLQHVSAYPLTIALLALATFCSTFGSSLYLQRVHGWDRTSAFLAGSPGALSQITMLAAREGRGRAGDRGGADHARDHSDRSAADAVGADRHSPGVATGHDSRDRLAARTDRIGRRFGGGVAAAAADKISGELDVRRHDRLQRAAWRRIGRGRPAALGARGRAGRDRRADRLAFRADEAENHAQPRQCGTGVVRSLPSSFRRYSSS